ncbi:hypothetical protein MMC19_005398 [Ptychographa xylographoides]|nr:hypothetical protein [Ptychographa xylographoides]
MSSGSEDRPRKRMRKGTRSCLECRRRKIRCVFQSDAIICNGCRPRGSTCLDQEFTDTQSLEKRKNMRERVGQLEGMIGQILHKLDTSTKDVGESDTSKEVKSLKADISRASSELNAAAALRSLQSELSPSSLKVGNDGSESVPNPPAINGNRFTNAPFLSLFDNAIFSQDDKDTGEVVAHGENTDTGALQSSLTKKHNILKALKALAPSLQDLMAILEASRDILPLSLRVLPEIIEGMAGSLEAAGVVGLRDHMWVSLESRDVLVVAKMLLCVAIFIQHLPAKFDYTRTNLPATSEALDAQYVRPVESLLMSDEGWAGSGLEAVLCMILQSKFYLNIGKPGKAWLINRRAMAFAQLIGVHHRQVGNSQDKLSSRKRNLWLQIWQHDRMFSLVLGLPYSVPESHFGLEDMEGNEDGVSLVMQFMFRMCIVTGRIIDRNHCPRNMTFARTLEIDQELEKSKEFMPIDWWDSSPDRNTPVEAAFDMCVGKFWYHNVRKLLHLPFMLKSFTDRRYEFSRVAALESSRDMLKQYKIFRDEQQPMLSMCDIVDFEAFSAAMILILHLLGQSSSTLHDPERDARDWELVGSSTRDMQRVSQEMSCAVAGQGAKILDDIQNARYLECGDKNYEAVIPYFGKIRIRRGPNLVSQMKSSGVSPSTTCQLLTPPDSISTVSEFGQEPLVSVDSYFQPVPYSEDATNTQGIDWMSTLNLDLRDDWNWFVNGAEMV